MAGSERIFISYRRKNSSGEANLIANALRRHVGEDAVFIDTANIKPGDSWPSEIEDALKEAGTMLILIGPSWLTDDRDEWGRRPIDDPDDWVHREVAYSLTNGVRVVPVLVRGATMPPPDALPEDIRDLSQKQYFDVRPDRWEIDLDVLVDTLGLAPKTKNSATTFSRSELHPLPLFGDVVTRNAPLSELTLQTRSNPVVCVEGLSGSGKTYLVSDFVRKEGLGLWYDAQNGEPLDDLLASLETEFDLGGGSALARCKRLAHLLSENGGTLVIDDFHTADQQSYAPLVKSIYARGGNCHLIFVSQTYVDFDLIHFPVPHVRIGGMNAEETSTLLVNRGLHIEPLIIQRLCAVSDGLPLAANLFATLVSHFGVNPEDLLLGSLLRADRIRRWCEYVFDLVEPDDRELIMRLSVSDAPFNRSTFMALATIADVTDPVNSLERLLSTYLVQRYTPYRWRVHRLLASFSLASLSEHELHRARIALAEHLIKGLSNRRGSIYREDELLWKSRAVRHFARAGELSRAQAVAHDISSTAKALGYYELLLESISSIPQLELSSDPWLQYHRAHCLLILGKFAKAKQYADLIEPKDDVPIRVSAARLTAECLISMGQYEEAQALLHAALSEASGKRISFTIMQQAKSTAVWLKILLGELAEAEEAAQNLLVEAERHRDSRSGAISLTHWGTIRRMMGDASGAEKHLKVAYELFNEIPDRRGKAWCSGQLALSSLSTSRKTAVRYAEETIAISAEIGEAGLTYRTVLQELHQASLPSQLEVRIASEIGRLGITI